MSDTFTSKPTPWVPFVAAIAGFSIFALILVVANYSKGPQPLPEGAQSPEQRKAILAEHRAKEIKSATSYAWVSEPNGAVQIPLDRAVEITIEELKAKSRKQ